jgi:uncharacterized glyoxalase superfamily protein PhnB
VREAVDWLCRSFGFMERLRIGSHRAQLTFGTGSIVVTQGKDSSAVSVIVRVDNIDDHYAQAKRSGAQIISPPTDYPYGELQYTAQDLRGHRWIFSQSIKDVDPSVWGGILFD